MNGLAGLGTPADRTGAGVKLQHFPIAGGHIELAVGIGDAATEGQFVALVVARIRRGPPKVRAVGRIDRHDMRAGVHQIDAAIRRHRRCGDIAPALRALAETLAPSHRKARCGVDIAD